MRKIDRPNFAKYEALIFAFVLFFKVLPGFFAKFSWWMFAGSESKLAILIRYAFLKKYCRSVGDNVFIGKYVVLKGCDNLTIGSNVSIHAFSYIDADGGVEIGDNVSIAHACSVVSFNHTWSNPELPIKYNPTCRCAIKISDDVWIGCGVRVLAGSLIRQRVVVAAGAVVCNELASEALYGGIPAKFIKTIC